MVFKMHWVNIILIVFRWSLRGERRAFVVVGTGGGVVLLGLFCAKNVLVSFHSNTCREQYIQVGVRILASVNMKNFIRKCFDSSISLVN
jgi:hypothetical protein